MPDNFGQRLPVDPRIVESVQKSPQMSSEQGPGFMSSWGGPAMYQEVANYPEEIRMVYYAVQEGITSPSEIEVATGLSTKDVSSAINFLERKQLLKQAQIIP